MRTRKCLLIAAIPLLALCLGCGRASVDRTNGGTNSALSFSPNGTLQQNSADSSRVGLVSLVRVIANPKEFDGKRIQVMGFIHLEFEGDAIYLSREDYQYGLDQNAIWLSIPKAEVEKYREINDSYAVVEGTFNADVKGHMGSFSGSIENITMLRRWAKARTPNGSR
jgi:hypothetical protein